MGKRASQSEIYYDYQLAKAQAAKLQELATRLRGFANQDYENIISEISLTWKGDSANAFRSKAEIIKSDLLNTANELERTSEKVLRTAKQIYQAEMNAITLIKE